MSTRVTRSSQRISKVIVDLPSATRTAVSSKRRQHKNTTTSSETDKLNSQDNSRDNDESNVENLNVTPPKQRKPCEKQNALSPSTLLHRLSLAGEVGQNENENQSDAVKVFSESQKSKIDNARKVLTTAETEELYGREKELNELSEFLTTNASSKTSSSIYISGQPGKCFPFSPFIFHD